VTVQLCLLATAVVSLSAGLLVGVSDNLPGILLVYMASIAVVLAYALRFRTQRQYERLLLYSVAGFAVTAILHNVFEAAASVAGAAWLRAVGGGIGAAFFLIAVLLCPAGFLVGLVGSIVKRLLGGGQAVAQ